MLKKEQQKRYDDLSIICISIQYPYFAKNHDFIKAS